MDRIMGYERELTGLGGVFRNNGAPNCPHCRFNSPHPLGTPGYRNRAGGMRTLLRPLPTPHWEIRENAAEISIFAPHLEAAVSRGTGTLTFRTRSGDPLLAEPGIFGRTHYRGAEHHHFRQSFSLEPDEALYGLGVNGRLDLRGEAVELPAPAALRPPLLISTRGYGIVWTTPRASHVYPGSEQADLLTWQTECPGGIDYYLIFGPRLDRIVASYRELTGLAALPPRAAFGLLTGAEDAVLADFRSRGFPGEGASGAGAEFYRTQADPGRARHPGRFETLRRQIPSDLSQVFSGSPFVAAEAGATRWAPIPQARAIRLTASSTCAGFSTRRSVRSSRCSAAREGVPSRLP